MKSRTETSISTIFLMQFFVLLQNTVITPFLHFLRSTFLLILLTFNLVYIAKPVIFYFTHLIRILTLVLIMAVLFHIGVENIFRLNVVLFIKMTRELNYLGTVSVLMGRYIISQNSKNQHEHHHH